MANEIIFKNPNTGQFQVLSASTIPTLIESNNGQYEGYPETDEYYMQLQANLPVTGTTIQSKQNIQAAYDNALGGGEYIPNAELEGKQARLAADVLAAGTSITIEKSTTTFKGITENILVADRCYLLMNRMPLPGESIWDTGVGADGTLKPAAEVILIDTGYSSGTSVTISRPDPNAADRKKGAVIQAIIGTHASYGNIADKGIRIELERPAVVVMTESDGVTVPSIDGGSQEIDVRFVQSAQQADTARSATDTNYPGAFGVVTHYGVWCFKKTGAFLNNVRGIPEQAPPSTVVALASLTTATVDDEDFLEIIGIDTYWNPADGALTTIDAGDYWITVRAMNQAAFDENLRISNAAFVTVTVA